MGEAVRHIEPASAVWRFFASVRLTVVLLLSLAATSIIGTLIPQNMDAAAYIAKYGIVVFRVFSILDLFDMYHAGWFRFLLAMLTLNVLICSFDRLPGTLKLVLASPPAFNLNRFRRLSAKSVLASDLPAEPIIERLAGVVAKGFAYSRIDKVGQSIVIFAERHRWTRLGFYLVHLSVVLLLLGGLIGSILGFDGFVNIPEGETVREIRTQNGGEVIPLDFEVRCDDFSVTFYDGVRPKEFRSKLTILEGGQPVMTRDVIVNDPLRYKGINIFQSSYGALSPKSAVLRLKSQTSGLQYQIETPMGKAIDLPEDGGTFVLQGFTNDYRFKDVSLGQALVGQLTSQNKPAVDVILPTRFQGFDKMRGGRFLFTIEELNHRYYTGLQVTKDPGVWMVYVGFILLIAGCFMTFFMSHQKLCVEAVPQGAGCQVSISGTANKNRLGMQRKVERLAGRFESLL